MQQTKDTIKDRIAQRYSENGKIPYYIGRNRVR